EAGKHGASKVYVADDPSLDPPLPQPRVDVVAKVVREGGYDAVLFAGSVLAADVAAGLAARLDAGLNWDLVDITSDFTGKRPPLPDSVYVEVGWTATPRIALFRPGSLDARETGADAPEVESVAVELEPHSTAARIVDQQVEESSGPSIEDAEIVVA